MFKSYFIAHDTRIELFPSHDNMEDAVEHAAALFAEMDVSRSHTFKCHIEVEDENSGEIVGRVEP